ncbi:hypothetical protein MSAR_37420 [Mycolicibacterium sarraceniae]|uniref:Uncharacterized protein n=1 Tax=Mycolicibacterium sarraceniae TaxID=1534348 RepID=A0A7I7SXR2_9MYCO|nr:hypothetical protein MSAR_37420 [Mycolicibacterium sarraceniae]
MRALIVAIEVGDANPYNGKSLALAKCWQRNWMVTDPLGKAVDPVRAEILFEHQDTGALEPSREVDDWP